MTLTFGGGETPCHIHKKRVQETVSLGEFEDKTFMDHIENYMREKYNVPEHTVMTHEHSRGIAGITCQFDWYETDAEWTEVS